MKYETRTHSRRGCLKAALALLLAVLLIASCVGCVSRNTMGAEPETPMRKQAVALVLCHRANSKAPNVSDPVIHEAIMNVIESYGRLFILRNDGTGDLIYQGDFEIEEQLKAGNSELLHREMEEQAASLLAQLPAIKAVTPEADTMEALRNASRALSTLDDATYEKSIIIVDSGLSTHGVLDYRNNLLSAEPEEIIEELKAKEAIPELSGVDVTWLQLGQVASPQEALPPRLYNRLLGIWQAVVKSGGGSFDYSELPVPVGAEDPTLPEVGVVEYPPEEPISFTSQLMEAETPFEKPIILSEEKVHFNPNSAEWVDDDYVNELLTPLADCLKAHPETTILLAGTAAGDVNTDFALSLSGDRADHIRSALISLGVSEAQVQSIGLGVNNPWHVSGAGLDGPIAARNRSVILLDTASEDAVNILSAEESIA